MENNINNRTIALVIILFNILIVTPLAAKGLNSSVQTTLTTGKNNGVNETYTGIWLNTKKNIGLSRNSLLSLKGKIGVKTYIDETSANVTDFNVSAAYLYQPSSGFYSPLYSAKLQLKQENFKGISTNTNKTSLSLFRSQPLNNQIRIALGYKLEQEKGVSNIDSQSLIFNLDFTADLKSLYYFNINLSDEDLSAGSNSAAKSSSNTANRVDIASGHLPGENGHNIGNTGSANNVFNSSNSSISIGTIYTLSNRHSFDIALIKHFYRVTNETSNTTSNSSSSYFAVDYFYHF